MLTGKITFAAKTDDDIERQLVHTLAHAIVFIVSICCLLIAGAPAGYICLFLLEPARLTKARPAAACPSCDGFTEGQCPPPPGRGGGQPEATGSLSRFALEQYDWKTPPVRGGSSPGGSGELDLASPSLEGYFSGSGPGPPPKSCQCELT